MGFARRACAVAALAIVLVLGPRTARAGDPAAAREQLKIGYTLSQDGKCDEAIAHLAESLRLDPKAITLINLANCEEKVGRLADALGHWGDARARAQTEFAKAIEAEAERRQTALDPRVPKLTIALSAGAPAGTTVTRDGVALGAVSLGIALPVNPGAHVVVARARAREDAKIEVAMAEGESKTIDVAPGAPRAEPGASRDAAVDGEGGRGAASPLVYVGFGAAIVGVSVGAVTGVMAMAKASSAKDACPNHECPDRSSLDDVDSGRTLGTISTISFVVGGVGAAVGVVALVLARPRRADASVNAGVAVGLGGASLRGTF